LHEIALCSEHTRLAVNISELRQLVYEFTLQAS